MKNDVTTESLKNRLRTYTTEQLQMLASGEFQPVHVDFDGVEYSPLAQQVLDERRAGVKPPEEKPE